MDGEWLGRIRWRRRGAWLWPAFIAAVAVDAVIGHALPPAGDSQTVVAAALAGLVLNLIGVVLAVPLAVAVRRRRRDLPRVVARDYTGTAAVVAIAVALLVAGVLHHATVVGDRASLRDAITRAQAWIGDRAPAEFRRNLEWVNTYTISAGIYRACVSSADGPRTYCVVVNTRAPFPQGVSFAGYEPNWMFSQGAN